MLAILLACAPSAPSPSVGAVTPGRGWQGEATDIVITGDNFIPDIVVEEAASGRVGTDFSAWLGTRPATLLEGVTLVDEHTLKATVPPTYGFATGSYDLWVQTPSGLTAVLPGAFEVTQSRAARLNLSATTAGYEAGDTATVFVQLFNTQGGTETVSHGVELTFTSTAEDPAISISTSGLENASDTWPTEQQAVWTGALTAGRATLEVTNQRLDNLTVAVESTEEPDYIDGSELLLTWSQAPLDSALLDLPSEDFVATAGEPFDLTVRLFDAADNPYTDTKHVFLDAVDCGDWSDEADVEGGEGTISVTLTTACDVGRIRVFNESFKAYSAEFAVTAGAHRGYAVSATPREIEAGQDLMYLSVDAVDAFDNPVTGVDTTVTVIDNTGQFGSGWTGCPALVDGHLDCQMLPTIAGENVTFTVEDPDGKLGVSGPVLVEATDPSMAIVLPQVDRAVAGEPFDVIIALVDPYGNAVEYAPGSVDPVMVSDDTGTAHCEWTGRIGDDQHFDCTVTTATAATTLVAWVGADEVPGSAATSVQVDNARLAYVDLTVDADPAVAGAAFTVHAVGTDTFGNAYTVQEDPVVDLEDTSGTLSPTTLLLDSDGTGTASVSISAAGTQVITAAQDGVTLGDSAPFEVIGGDAVSLGVVGPPWVVAGGSASVTVTAYDAWGNVAPAYDGVVSVAGSDRCGAVEAPDFVSGSITVEVPCDTAGLDEEIYAADGSFGAHTDPFDVLDFSCADPPVAALTLDGDASPKECFVGPTTIDVDASGSTAGGAALRAYYFRDDEGWAERSEDGVTVHVYDEPGTRAVAVVVVDEDACATQAFGYVYLAPDNGEPAGPIQLVLSPATTSSLGSVDVTASALDCTGDAPVGAYVYVRADVGTLLADATGSGLRVPLDATGHATFEWDFDSGHAATALLLATSESGGAYGEVSLEVGPDVARPHVVELLPSGRDLGTYDSVTVTFDADLSPVSVDDGVVVITGPSGDIPVTVALDADTIVATPTTPLDGALGAYTITVLSDVRGTGGYKLDGAWSGVTNDFSVQFGDLLLETSLIESCTPSPSRFSPDGDNGAGEEADSVSFDLPTALTPAWWWLQVFDSDGVRVRSTRVPGTDTLTWDGRGNDSRVQNPGTYTTTVRGIDAYGSWSAPCSSTVELSQNLVQR